MTRLAVSINSTISAHKPNLVKVASGVTSPHIAKVTQYPLIFSPFFLSFFFAGEDDEMFMTRSLNVTPKTTEQRI